MSITYGFYNSTDGDRRYDAIQLSSIFDGIINDGVYETIGDCFIVTPLDGMTVSVGTGRAWFNHTWTLNDAVYPVTVATANPTYNRCDCIAIEVNEDTRTNSIVYISGTASSSYTKPTLTNTDTVHQYPLAYILVSPGAATITSSMIENAVGTSACPFVIGVIEVMSVDYLINQWSAQWNNYLDARSSEFSTWLAESKLTFETWFTQLQNELDENQAANLQNQIYEINQVLDKIITGGEFLHSIDDSDGNAIQDYLGNDIEGVVRLQYA